MRTWLVTSRKNKGLSHQDVADAANIKRQYYGMIENGDRTPSVKIAKTIGRYLEIDWTLFFENQGNKTLQKKREEVS